MRAVHFVLLVFYSANTIVKGDNPWRILKNTNNQYKLLSAADTFNTQSVTCTTQGGILTSVRSLQEARHIDELLNVTENYWVGLYNDLPRYQQLWWSDTVNPIVMINHRNYKENLTNLRNPFSELCVAIISSSQWRSIRCEDKLPAVCKKLALNEDYARILMSEGWKRLQKSAYFYKGISTPDAWKRQRATCIEEYGSDLVSIHGQLEESVVETLVPFPFWIGLASTFDNLGEKKFSDGSKVDKGVFRHGYPLWENKLRCGLMVLHKGIINAYCEEKHMAVCKKTVIQQMLHRSDEPPPR